MISIYSVPPLISAVLIFCLGVAILTRSGRTEANRVFSLFCFAIFVWLLAYSIAYSTENPHSAYICARIACTAVAFPPTFFYHFITAFLGLREERKYVGLCYGLTFVFLIGFLFSNLLLDGTHHYFWGYYSRAGKLHPLYIAITSSMWLRSSYLLYRSLRDRRYSERHKQIQYTFLASVLGAPGLLDFVPKYGVEIYPFGFCFVVMFVLIISYAILRYQLIDIRVVIGKSLVYSALIAVITGTYLVGVLVLERWFQGFMGYQSVIATFLVAFLIAIGFNPLRGVMQAFVDRLLFQGTPLELVAQRERLLTQVAQGEQMRAVATLASGMAHEIKNPLSSIKTFAQYLPEKYNDPIFREKFFRIVQVEIDRIDNLVRDLLDFAKPAPLETKPINLSSSVEDTLLLLAPHFMKHGIDIRKSFNDNGLCINADPKQLKQIILNLILNSIEAMEGGGRLELSIQPASDVMIFRVADTGCGIEPGQLHLVGDPFFTTKERGMGLGMAIVKGVVERHGGKITISSAPGKGTTVELSLPIARG